ncbi:hypothetical protein [Halobellus captivus]|uniref:hypothetical protein n=1 Tax=Halobellus captivus TaxID=2592614 RepID=UPI0011A5E7A4|nr:hypothetical protein [Halobellus captivus]
MSFNVFEIRGVYLFEGSESVPPSLEGYYNDAEDRYEIPEKGDLNALRNEWRLVTDLDAYRVVFDRDPPADVRSTAVFVEEGPIRTTLLCPDEAAVDRALEAGGRLVEGET